MGGGQIKRKGRKYGEREQEREREQRRRAGLGISTACSAIEEDKVVQGPLSGAMAGGVAGYVWSV